MRLAETVALGLMQGPAELLPISSSAHAELIPWLLSWEHADLPDDERKEVEVALHAGTALTLAAVHWRASLDRAGLLVLATAPPALAALAWERQIEARMGTPESIAAGLLLGSAALVLADRAPERRDAGEATVADALWLGLAQTAALMPGVSRSGATRAAARARGFHRADAAELSREVALPILVGATVLKGVRLAQRRPAPRVLCSLGAAAATAALSTFAAGRLSRGTHVPLAAWAAYRTGVAVTVLAVRQNRRR
jgi:undecaprenyl-diphosphatase